MHTILISHAFEQVWSERESCAKSVVGFRKQFVAAVDGLPVLRERVRQARAALEEFEKPDLAEPPQRRTFEEGLPHVTDDLARRRRAGEHRQERERLHDRLGLRQHEYDTARSAAKGHYLDILARCELASHRARALWHHFESRRAVYSQQLVRTHREGPRLNRILEQAEPRMPDWVADPRQLPLDFGITLDDVIDSDLPEWWQDE